MRVLGVDPGLRGALALWDTEMDLLVVQDMPVVKVGKTTVIPEHLLVDRIRRLAPEIAWIEEVHAMPKQGVVSTFTFGMGYGMVRGACAGLGIRIQPVSPNVWKAAFRLRRDKGVSRTVAMRLFPHNASDFALVKHDGRAEAALIALYGSDHCL